MRHMITTLLCLLLAACGGGGGDDDAPAQPLAAKHTDLLVIGNSITRHPPLASIAWAGDWGMAASSRDRDFAHLVGAGLGLPVTATNAAQLERDPSAPLPDWQVGPGTVVVLELGDNGLPARYADIVAAVRGGASLTCLSTYWEKPERDAVIKATCEAAGGRYVYIGDIYPTRQDVMGPELHSFVVSHPGDWSMARIAERVLGGGGL